MQTFKDNRFNVSIDFCILTAAFLLLLPLKWVCGWFAASALHELFHISALRLCGVRIFSVSLRASGAEIETEAMDPHQEMLSALAGPIGGLCALFVWKIAPHMSICAFVQSLFNLIPIYPLDGGRVLRCCIYRIFNPESSEKICAYVENTVLLLLFLFACFCAIRFRLGGLPVAISLILFFKCRKIKIPCKHKEQIVQ